MAWTLTHRREDGTYVIDLNGNPYHVIPTDPLFAEVAAADTGQALAPEPPPPPLTPVAQVPDATLAGDIAALRCEVAALTARIETLEDDAP